MKSIKFLLEVDHEGELSYSVTGLPIRHFDDKHICKWIIIGLEIVEELSRQEERDDQ